MPRKSQTESLADVDAAPGGVAAVDRALSLLRVFRVGDEALSLAELAQRTRLYKSTVLRLLASLEHAHLVQRLEGGPHHGSWALGSEVARLHRVYAASFSLEHVVLPVLRSLVETTGESAAYHIRQGDTRLCLYRVDSPQPIRDHIRAGDLLPLDRGAGARVLIAFGETPDGPLYREDEALYESIRAQGYYAAKGDRSADVAGVSAPVFSSTGKLAGAITLTLPLSRFDERHIPHVVEAARLLSSRI